MKTTYKHTIPASVSRVIQAYQDPHFYEEKQKHFGALSVEILQWDITDDGVLSYRVKVTEPSRQPSFIRKSDEDTYTEESVLDTKKGILTWKVIPEIGADKFSMNGLMEFKPDGEESTLIVYNVDLKVKIPLVGKKVEKYALDKSEEETAKQAKYLTEWLAVSDNK